MRKFSLSKKIYKKFDNIPQFFALTFRKNGIKKLVDLCDLLRKHEIQYCHGSVSMSLINICKTILVTYGSVCGGKSANI